jgi:hypothetical protein
VTWIGIDGGHLVSGQTNHYLKLRNIERDPGIVLSFTGAPRTGCLHESLRRPEREAHRRTPATRAWGPRHRVPAPKGPGYIVRYSIERIGGWLWA